MIFVHGDHFKFFGWPGWFGFAGELPSELDDGVSPLEAWLAVRTRFATEWTGTQPIQYPNQRFTPPSGSTWLRLEMTQGDARNASLGITHIRYTGVIWIGVYIPNGTGLMDGLELAETAAAIFENTIFDRVHCWAASIKDAGIYSGWRQITVTIPYWHDVLR